METITFNVDIHWRDEAEGGKARLPLDQTYYVTTSPLSGPDGTPVTWSLVLQVTDNCTVKGHRVGAGSVRLLVPNAPKDLLHPGRRLEVFEGQRPVGWLEIQARHEQGHRTDSNGSPASAIDKDQGK